MANAYTRDNNLAMFIIEDVYSAYNTIKAAGLEDKYMLAALPKIEDGEFKGITSSHMGDWNMAICNTSTQKDLAWEFMKFMVMDDVVQQWILDTYCIPANKEASGKAGRVYACGLCGSHFLCCKHQPAGIQRFCKQLLRQQQLRHLYPMT